MTARQVAVKTVRVRILVAVDRNGEWSCYGSSNHDDNRARDYIFLDTLEKGERYSWIEANVPLPDSDAIEGEVG